MFENQNRIIIVDNVQTELEQLGKSFFINGLGCRTFLYEQGYYEPLKNVRVAFFDINLSQGNPEITETETEEILEKHSKVFNDLANALNQYISLDNGPYALIFWTKNSQVINAFKIFMQNPARGFNDITAKPIFIGHLDKVDIDDSEDFTFELIAKPIYDRKITIPKLNISFGKLDSLKVVDEGNTGLPNLSFRFSISVEIIFDVFVVLTFHSCRSRY